MKVKELKAQLEAQDDELEVEVYMFGGITAPVVGLELQAPETPEGNDTVVLSVG